MKNHDVSFIGIESMSIVEQDLSKFTYHSIKNGSPEFGTTVNVQGSACYIQTPLMTYFNGTIPLRATGVALVQLGDERNLLRARILAETAASLPSNFDIEVVVKPMPEIVDTSAATKSIVLFAFATAFLLGGLVGI